MRGVPTGMKWNAVEWWNTAVHAPAFLLSSPLLLPFFSFSFFLFFLFFFFPLLFFSPFNRAGEQSPPFRGRFSPLSFPLASYVRNEPQLIHHNRFTCMSAGTFTLPPLSPSLSPSLVTTDVPLSLAFGPIRSFVLLDFLEILPVFTGWNKDRQMGFSFYTGLTSLFRR